MSSGPRGISLIPQLTWGLQKNAFFVNLYSAGRARCEFDGVPVEVVCELGRVTMTGREVLELRPGAVIPVGRPLAGPVDLTVGGRVVARGELVDVEGEIGVRITQICE